MPRPVCKGRVKAVSPLHSISVSLMHTQMAIPGWRIGLFPVVGGSGRSARTIMSGGRRFGVISGNASIVLLAS